MMTAKRPAKQSDRDVWRVGVLFSRTGLMAVSESEHFFDTALAIQEINEAGGILGREIEVVAYDPGSNPETYRKMADRLREGARLFEWRNRSARPGQIRDGRWLIGMGMAAATRRPARDLRDLECKRQQL
jgi:CO/xanthine dehydrogenase Mo-binding subunit